MKILACAIIAVAALVGTCSAKADTIGIHVGSQHYDTSVKFNNVNPGVYYKTDSGITVGAYYNSYRNASVYAAYTLETARWHGLSAAITAGLVTGYPAAPVVPMLLPSVAGPVVGTDVRWRLGVTPRVHPKQSAVVVHLMFERSF